MSVLMPDHRERALGFGEDWEKVGGLYLPPLPSETRRPTGMDLFAGAGGFSLGMHTAGFHMVAASEWWPIAAETYLCNLGSPSTVVHVGKSAAPDATKKERKLFEQYGGEAVPAGVLFPAREETVPAGTHVRPDKHAPTRFFGPGTGWISSASHELADCAKPDDPEWHAVYCCVGEKRWACEHFWLCDAGELTGEAILEALGLELGELDVVVGGPPCQGFSTANVDRSSDDPRNLLVFEFARIVCELKPKAMVMENVPAIASMTTAEGIPVVDALCHVLEAGGMGGYEALRKSLLTTSGAGAVVNGARDRTKRKSKSTRPSADSSNGARELPEEVEEQLALEVASA